MIDYRQLQLKRALLTCWAYDKGQTGVMQEVAYSDKDVITLLTAKKQKHMITLTMHNNGRVHVKAENAVLEAMFLAAQPMPVEDS